MASIWGETRRVRRARQWMVAGFIAGGAVQILVPLGSGSAAGFVFLIVLPFVIAWTLRPAWNAIRWLARSPRGSVGLHMAAQALIPPAAVVLLAALGSLSLGAVLLLSAPALPVMAVLSWLALQPEPEPSPLEQLGNLFT